MSQGDPGGNVLVLLHGRVKVTARDSNGDELLVAMRGSGDLVGEFAIHSDIQRSASVEAIDRCTARAISIAMFREFLALNQVSGPFTAYLVAKLAETVPYKLRLVHFAPGQRLARLLLEIVMLAEPGHPDRMKIPFTQEGLARALGLARSTVAEQLSIMRRVGILAPGRRLVVLDLEKLGSFQH